MDDLFTPEDWLRRSYSNLIRGKNTNLKDPMFEGVFIEDLCFDLQQATEKALKAILIKFGVMFPKTHDISELIKLIKTKTTIQIPDFIKESAELTKYAVKTRYPNWNTVSENAYREAVIQAEKVYYWAKEQIS